MLMHSHKVCLAPMMDRTDRHFRFLLRLIAPRTFLYTEMITSAALVRGDASALLTHDAAEHPVGIQLGGSDPKELARAAEMSAAAGFDEINLNVGCPSDRVQAGAFGAALMREPERVAACVRAMKDVVDVPVTVKTRIGVDDQDSYEFLTALISAVERAGADLLVVHARKAWLKGLSPKQNREIPPLDHGRVHRLRGDFPNLALVINGGIRTADDAVRLVGPTDGVMIGRAAYDDPLEMRAIECALIGEQDYPPLAEVLDRFAAYAEGEVASGQPLRRVARHLMGVFTGRPGARSWRRFLGTLDDGRAGIEELRARLDELARFEALPRPDAIARSDERARADDVEALPKHSRISDSLAVSA